MQKIKFIINDTPNPPAVQYLINPCNPFFITQKMKSMRCREGREGNVAINLSDVLLISLTNKNLSVGPTADSACL